ncbi:MAG: Rrf2 family transcriptional regulator [Bacteroidetes bacterium]|nr:MAG: Rrf2 family transcriptional regulator [Bacteroidota bacterium]
MGKVVNITEAVSIGLHSMVLIAQTKEQINVHEIAERTSSSKFHIAKILQKLVKENYLTSQRGPAGGFMLAKPPETISLLNIYECIEGEINLSECPINRPTCPFSKCIFGKLTIKMTRDFKDYLSSKYLSDFLDF